MKFPFIVVIILLLIAVNILAQKNTHQVLTSSLLGISLPVSAARDNGLFSIASAKTVLEMEASQENIAISLIEVLIFSNSNGLKDSSVQIISELKAKLIKDGYELFISRNDAAFSWLSKDRRHYLLYSNASKREADAYFGLADKLPGYILQSNQLSQVQSNSPIETMQVKAAKTPEVVIMATTNQADSYNSANNNSELVGNWGTLNGAKVSWRDESTSGMLVSEVSKGYGLELQQDGNFLQTTVVTSGRPNYRVFTSTTGKWSVKENQIWFYPEDRHYRKWENEIIMVDEHSVPKTYFVFWRMEKNDITGKNCLYIKYETESDFRELCNQ